MKSKTFRKKLTLNKKTIADLNMDKVKGANVINTLRDCVRDTSAMPECSAIFIRCTCWSGNPDCGYCQ